MQTFIPRKDVHGACARMPAIPSCFRGRARKYPAVPAGGWRGLLTAYRGRRVDRRISSEAPRPLRPSCGAKCGAGCRFDGTFNSVCAQRRRPKSNANSVHLLVLLPRGAGAEQTGRRRRIHHGAHIDIHVNTRHGKDGRSASGSATRRLADNAAPLHEAGEAVANLFYGWVRGYEENRVCFSSAAKSKGSSPWSVLFEMERGNSQVAQPTRKPTT